MALNLFEKLKNALNSNTTTNVDTYTNDGMNLSGVNNIQNAVGTPRQTRSDTSTATSSYSNSLGTPAKQPETAKDFTQSYSKAIASDEVARNTQKYQSTLSSVADESNKKAQSVLNTISNTFSGAKKAVDDYFVQNKEEAQNTQAGLTYQRLEQQRQDAIDLDDKNRNEIYNTITENDINNFADEYGNAKDFNLIIDNLQTEIKGYNELLESNIPETQKIIVESQLNEAKIQLAENEELSKKYKAFEEKFALDNALAMGDEETYNYLKEAYSHKDDNIYQRFGTAMGQLVVDTVNEIPNAIDQIKYTGQTADAMARVDELNALHNTGQLSDNAYAEAMKYWSDAIESYRSDYNDGFSQVLREASSQLNANTYYDASQIETFVLQAGYSTAQFLEHFAIGVATAGLLSQESALIRLGEQIVADQIAQEMGLKVTEEAVKNAIQNTAKSELIKLGTRALGGQIATGTMSLASTVAKTNQLLEEGYSPDIAFQNGLFTGIVSYVTEKVGMDRFVNMLGTEISVNILGQIIQRNIKSAVSEGLEEVVEGIVDPLIDSVTLGKDYEVNGSELLMEFMLGGTSGLLMATGATAISATNSAIQVNNFIKARQQARLDTQNQIGQLTVNTREQYNKLQKEVQMLDEFKSSMTPEQVVVADECINKAVKALDDYANKTTTMGVVFSYELVENNSVEENTQTIYEATEPDFNQEVQENVNLNELQSQIDSDVEQLAIDEINYNNNTQEILNQNGYNIDAKVYNSLSPKQQNQSLVALDFAKAMGLNVGVVNNLAPGFNGFVDGEGNIVIDGTKNPVLFTLSHELTHGTEQSKFYPVLKQIVQSKFSDWNQAVEKKINDYRKAGQELTPEQAEKEVVARYVEDKLGDEKFINDLIKYNYSLASKIWQDLKSLGVNEETAQIRNAFEKAFVDAQEKMISDSSIKYSAGGQTGLSALLYSEDPDLRAYGQSLSEKLDKAIQLDREGLTPEWNIWDETGWIKKADGKWRFQFYDGADKTFRRLINYLSRADGKTVGWLDDSLELSDFIGEDNILFKMYPDLKDVAISFYADKENASTLGRYDKGEDLGGGYRTKPSISMNLASFRNSNGYLNFNFASYANIAETFFHELQHAIQVEEGFEDGSNLTLGAREYVENIKSKAKEESERLISELKNTGLTKKQIDKAVKDYRDNYMFGEYISQLNEDQQRMIQKLNYELEDLESKSAPYEKAFEIYNNNLGEIEAREEARRALSENDRKVSPEYDGRLKPDLFKDSGNSEFAFENDKGDIIVISNEELQKNRNDILKKEPIEINDTYGLSIKDGRSLRKKVLEFFNNVYNGKVQANVVGVVALDNRGIKNDLAHGISKLKSKAFIGVPEVLKTGLVTDLRNDYNGKSEDRIIISAPVTIDGVDYIENVILRQTPGGRKKGDKTTKLYLHDIALINKESGKMTFIDPDLNISGETDMPGSWPSDTTSKFSFSLDEQNVNTQAQLHKDRAVEEYGITDDPFLAGYLMDDGRYLDFSEGQGYRVQDHRNVGFVFDDYNPATDGMSQGMIRFMNEGNIRIQPESNGVDISDVNEPTSQQYNSLYDYFDMLSDTGFRIDVSNDEGRNVFSIEYPPNTSPRKAINDLKQFYEDGTIPEVNNSSNYFRYSFDSEGSELNPEQQEYFKDSKIRNKDGELLRVYHGTRGDFTVFDLGQGGQSNSKAGIGFWFTPSKQGATNFANDAWYGDGEGKAMETYLNITNPYVYEEIDNTELLESIDKQMDEINDEIKSIKETTNHIMMDNIENRYYVDTLPNPVDKLVEKGYKEEESKLYVEQHQRIKELQQLQKQLKQDYYNNRYTDPYEQFKTDIYKLAGQSADDANVGGIGMGLNNPKETLQKYRDGLIEQGYDGIIIKGTRYDSSVFGGNNDQYVAFYPEQIKKVDNLNPTTNPDIRLSFDSDTQKSVQDNSDRSQYFDYGMNPTRNVDIQRRTEAGPTSRFWNNLANSQYASDEEAQRIKKMVEDGLGSYEQTSRKRQDTEARKMLREMGIEDAFKYMMNSDSISTMSVDNALGRALISEMNQKGLADTENYRQLESRMQWRATMQGQALEAWKGFRDSTPEGQVVTIRSEIERIQKGLNERYGERAYNIVLDEGLIEEYLRARTQEEREAIREQIARDVAKQIPPSAIEQLNSFRHLSMLFNPRTWIKNSLANKMFGYINEGTRAVRSVLESIAYEMGKNNEKSVFSGMERQAGTYNPFSSEDRKQFKRFKEQYNNQFKNKIDMKYSAIDAGNVLLGTEFGEEVSRFRDSFTSGLLNKASEFNAKMMSDAPGMSTAYAKALIGYLKVNGLDYETMSPEQIEKAQEFAINEAKYATFNSYNKLASDIAKFANDGSKARRVVIESFLPFKRTPLNLIRTGFRYTPVGLAETLTYELSNLKKGKITANQFIDDMAQGMTGSALMMLGALLSHMGIFRTKDDDSDRKQYFDQENGEQDYSINWDGGSYTIDWADPMIVPLAMGAELMKYVESGEFSLDDAFNLATSLADPMFETSMLSGIQKNLSSYATGTTQWWGKIAQNAITNYVQQYVPSILGATARTLDDTRRSTYTDKGAFDRAYRQTLNKIPGLSQLNEPYINREGQEQKNQGNNIIDRAILNFISPGYYADKDLDNYDKELYRLYEETGTIDALPSSASKSLTYEKEKYNFTPEEYTQWQKTRWQTEAEYVNQFIDSKAYKSLTNEERVDTIKDIRSYAQKVAKKQFLNSKGIEYDDDKQLNSAQGALDKGIDLYAYYDYLNNAGSKQADKVKYLEDSGLSKKQKEYLWGTSDYKTSYEDAYAKVFGKK